MKVRLSICFLVLMLALAACDATTKEARRMVKRAERLADTLPDSTVRLVDSVLRMPVNFRERERMDMALLQAEALFGDRGQEISPVMDDDFFDDRGNVSTSPELERAAAYYARKEDFAKAAHAALYSGFVQQHYDEKEAAMRSFKEAERYGMMASDSLTVARAEYWMGKMLLNNGMYDETLLMAASANQNFGTHYYGKAMVQNLMAVPHLLLGEYENAELCLQQSLIYAKQSQAKDLEIKTINNYAVLYQLQGKYNQAIVCLRQIEREHNLDDTETLLLNMNLGDIFIETYELDSAALYFNRIDSLLSIIQMKTETKVAAYKSLSKFAESQNNDSLALFYRKQYEGWLNKIRDEREHNKVYEIQQKYDYGVLQNIMSKKIIRRQSLAIFLSIAVALALMAFVISQIRLAKIRKQEAEIKSSLLRFMQQNEELTMQSEAANKAHHDLEQKYQEKEEAFQTLAYKAEEYKNALEVSDKKLSKALLKEQQTMQKMAVYLGNKKETALFEALRYSVLGNQEYWDAMTKIFDEQFPGMRKELTKQHPDLTETEQKILLLSYVDASREDTALLLDISIFMVDKLRTSVKKKMAAKTTNDIAKA